MTKLICFDLWETLATEPSTFEECWQPLYAAYPDRFPPADIKKLINQVIMKKDQPLGQSVAEILEQLAVNDSNLVSAICEQWQKSCDAVTLFPDTEPALNGLKSEGYKLGVISNTSTYGWQAVNRKYKILEYFDYQAPSFKVGYIKPESDIYLSIERISGFSGKEIIMVGDSFRGDFLKPRELGWGSILLDRAGANEHPDAKPMIQNLLQLKSIL